MFVLVHTRSVCLNTCSEERFPFCHVYNFSSVEFGLSDRKETLPYGSARRRLQKTSFGVYSKHMFIIYLITFQVYGPLSNANTCENIESCTLCIHDNVVTKFCNVMLHDRNIYVWNRSQHYIYAWFKIDHSVYTQINSIGMIFWIFLSGI